MASREFRRMRRRLWADDGQYFLPSARSSRDHAVYIWQDYDLQPEFPHLRKFLDFWQKSLDGRLHSVQAGA